MKKSTQKFTAVYRKSGKWYIGWIEEVPGANTQGKTIKELKENLKEAVTLILESNRILNREITDDGKVTREKLTVSL
ncbi:MAG: HicB family protein [Candidatus Harrisonbacteria bacterium CG10_big_fil_rev_8_21_14_0_10_49_15]|uniref:HicB family protein n=1 Tax=Candidatus Harrisonbacteria bacterium CG10_big_fil_rev_8_21_14_0_10_49_15 TaxID=1974587 RepID=A0A2H0UMN4_9BACT|nr:MAG: HicB family protein [Candidatus Harrisonbacteria bacterium CG10_big_fil_rev_8_21_14_0_10_49_15]